MQDFCFADLSQNLVFRVQIMAGLFSIRKINLYLCQNATYKYFEINKIIMDCRVENAA